MKWLVLACALALSACASSNVIVSAGVPAAVQGGAITTGPSGLHVYAQGGTAVALILTGVLLNLADPMMASRPAPELLPGRPINEQDCTQPVDFFAGNLRCK